MPIDERYAAIGRALADPKRLCVLESLAIGELSVSDLSTRVGCQVPNMSQHLAVLRSAGLVTSRREGNTSSTASRTPRVLEAYRLIQTLARLGRHRSAPAARGRKDPSPMAEIKVATDATFEELVLKNERPSSSTSGPPGAGPARWSRPRWRRSPRSTTARSTSSRSMSTPTRGLSRAFNIMSIPTIAFFKPGQQPQGVVGFRPMEQLEPQFGLAEFAKAPDVEAQAAEPQA